MGYEKRTTKQSAVQRMKGILLVAGLLSLFIFFAVRRRCRKKAFIETRKYARALFYSGIITMEELQRFYDTHPEKEDFDGNGNG